MKISLLTNVLLLTTTTLFAQDTKGVLFYVDSLHNISNEKSYKYTRIVEDYESKRDTYLFSEYYKSGTRSMKALSKNKDSLIIDGLRIDYYESGNKKQEAVYKNNYYNGKQTEWYDNQNKKIERILKWDPQRKTYIVQILQFWDKNNIQKIIDGNGEYEETTKILSQKGVVKDSYKQGVWTGYDYRTQSSFSETYEKGQLISGISTDKNNINHPYTLIEEQPHPQQNNLSKFSKDFIHNLRLPSSVRDTNFNYRLLISFTVDKNGYLVEIIPPKKLGSDFCTEIIQAVSKSEKWIPGKKRGIPTATRFAVPIGLTNRNY